MQVLCARRPTGSSHRDADGFPIQRSQLKERAADDANEDDQRTAGIGRRDPGGIQAEQSALGVGFASLRLR